MSRNYSQYGEDKLIAKLIRELGFSEHIHKSNWVCDIGAWDGLEYSNVQALVERGASALEIEANPARYADLCKLAEKWPIVPIQAEVTKHNINEILHNIPMDERTLLLNLDIDGDHAGILRTIYRPWDIVVVEWCDHGDTSQKEPLLEWAKEHYTLRYKTASNLIFKRRPNV